MKGKEVVFSHKSDEWATPQALFDRLNAEFAFTLDGAASTENHKTPSWYGPGGVRENALEANDFAFQTVFLNPPYSMIKEFMDWIHRNRHTNTFVCLMPSRTDTRWWHQYIWDGSHPKPGVEVRFIKGRLKFMASETQPLRNHEVPSVASGRHAPNNSAPFPSVIIIFRG